MSLSSKLSITDVDLKGKRVLIRVSKRTPLPRHPKSSRISITMTSPNKVSVWCLNMLYYTEKTIPRVRAI